MDVPAPTQMSVDFSDTVLLTSLAASDLVVDGAPLTSMTVVDGDGAAVLGRLTAYKCDDGHAISYRIAHFIKFRDEKVVEYMSIIDSFDAVE